MSAPDAPDNAIATITQSTRGSDTQVIPENYFMISKGSRRLKEVSNYLQWKQWKERVHKMEDGVLKEKMILETQPMKVTYTKQDNEDVVGRF